MGQERGADRSGVDVTPADVAAWRGARAQRQHAEDDVLTRALAAGPSLRAFMHRAGDPTDAELRHFAELGYAVEKLAALIASSGDLEDR